MLRRSTDLDVIGCEIVGLFLIKDDYISSYTKAERFHVHSRREDWSRLNSGKFLH